MHKSLLIIGASGHGKVVAEIALMMKKWERVAFLDDDERIQSPLRMEVIGKSNDAFNYIDDCEIFVAIGDNKVRCELINLFAKNGANIPVLVHPAAIIGKEVTLNSGSVVMAGVVINCDTKIGKGCIINTGATIDHDNVIEDYVHVSPGVHLSGNVKVGSRTWIGVGSTISNNVYITSDCIIGAGSVVVKDITEPGTYVGIPSKKIR